MSGNRIYPESGGVSNGNQKLHLALEEGIKSESTDKQR